MTARRLPKLAAKLQRRYPDLDVVECIRETDCGGDPVTCVGLQGTPDALVASGLITSDDAAKVAAGDYANAVDEYGCFRMVSRAYDSSARAGCWSVHLTIHATSMDHWRMWSVKNSRALERMVRKATGVRMRFADLRGEVATGEQG